MISIQKNGPSAEEKTLPQILAITIASASAITLGLLFSWSSPFLPMITEDKQNYDISEDQASYFTIIPPIMMIVSCPIFSKLCDTIGRKPTLMFISVPQIIAWLLTTVSNKIWVLYLSRVSTGIGDGCLMASLPVYIGEISNPRIRGTWGNLLTVFIYFGSFLVNLIGSFCNVKQTAYICVGLPIIYIGLVFFLPESPYFYLMKNEELKAKASLRKLKGREDVDEIFTDLKSKFERQKAETGSWKDLISVDNYRRAITAGVFLRTSQQLGGAAAFSVYTNLIFKRSGTDVSPEVSTMIYTGLCFVVVSVCSFVPDKVGRRKSYLISLILCGIVLLMESLYLYLDEKVASVNLRAWNWFPLAAMILYVIFCSSGILLIPTLMSGELFATSIKAKGSSILTITFGVMMFVGHTLFYHLLSLGLYAPFLFFGSCCIISSVLTVYIVPETKGKTLEEIQQNLKKGSIKK